MAIIELTDVKTYLGITATTEDAKLTQFIGFVDAQIKQYCRQNFEQATYTEYYSGTGVRTVVLLRRPVQSITSVYLDQNAYYGQATPSFAASTILTVGTDYALELDESLSNGQVVSRAGIMVRVATIWPEMNASFYPGRITQEYGPAFGNIKVTYVAGYPAAAFPQDVKLAACMMVAGIRRSAPFGGMTPTGERISDYSYTLATRYRESPGVLQELGSARQILSRYREIAIGMPNASAPGAFGR